MESVLLFAVILLALVVGFSLGIFFLSLDNPLSRRVLGERPSSLEGSPEKEPSGEGSVEETEPGGTSDDDEPSEEDTAAGKEPAPPGQLILEAYLQEGNDPLFISLGKTYRREDLPAKMLEMLQFEASTVGSQMTPSKPQDLQEPLPQPMPEDQPEPQKEVKLLSVIEEIDKILQEKLKTSPLGDRGIQLMENQRQEIRIWVGLQSYDAIEDIPDADVRALIMESVEEWEQRES